MGHEPVCKHVDYYERLMRYEMLRDDGLDHWAAGQEIGLKEAAAAAYERWYRRRKGLRDRERSPNGTIAFAIGGNRTGRVKDPYWFGMDETFGKKDS